MTPGSTLQGIVYGLLLIDGCKGVATYCEDLNPAPTEPFGTAYSNNYISGLNNSKFLIPLANPTTSRTPIFGKCVGFLLIDGFSVVTIQIGAFYPCPGQTISTIIRSGVRGNADLFILFHNLVN